MKSFKKKDGFERIFNFILIKKKQLSSKYYYVRGLNDKYSAMFYREIYLT